MASGNSWFEYFLIPPFSTWKKKVVIMAMNPATQRKHQLPWLPSLIFLSLLTVFSAASASSSNSLSYSHHCGSVVPESTQTVPTTTTTAFPFRQTALSHYTGGDRVLSNLSSQFSFNPQKYVSFRPIRNPFKTNTIGVYMIEAYLMLRSPDIYYLNGSYPSDHRRRISLRFLLKGFWSEVSGKLCMVGSASWYSNKGNSLNLDAVLKLNYAAHSTIFTSLITGKLESVNSPNDQNYFEPVSILVFGSSSRYQYSLGSGEFGRMFQGGIPFPENQSLGLPGELCSTLWSSINYLKLEYKNDCNALKNCTPLGQGTYLPMEMSLNSIQCSEEEGKVLYLVKFGYGPFDRAATLVGEGSWDEKRNRMCIVACRILNSTVALENSRVGDCSIRLSLRYPAFWSIRNRTSIVGQIWTNKTINEPGYFNRIAFRSRENNMVGVSGLRYEYTEVERVRKLCPKKKLVKRKGERYPKGNSNDMRFGMSILDSMMRRFAFGYAAPVFVGDQIYEEYPVVINIPTHDKSEVEPESSHSGSLNISYTLSVYGNSSTNSSFMANGMVEISAEGVYDDETGDLCMLGCRKESPGESMDCELLLKFQFPPTNAQKGGLVKGSIESMRKKTDPLYFEHLNVSSMAFYTEEAKRSVWRMDLEIAMVLISNTLTCVFVGLQIFHAKRDPQVLPSVSLFMLVILTLGHMIPLVLNFEALFLGSRDKQNVLLGSGGWIEVNEVVVRVVTMVAFLLQIRLLQLVFSARLADGIRKGLWAAEKKALFVSSPLYIVGVLFAILLYKGRKNEANAMVSSTSAAYQTHSLWEGLRSYGGLVLDGFLLPQILLNVFQIPVENVLSRSFYMGTTCVRLLPHAYDLYRAHNYARNQFDGAYIYANPNADFYSSAWDVAISCGGVLLAFVIFLQQRFGGRCILPRRFREVEVYEKVPVVSSE